MKRLFVTLLLLVSLASASRLTTLLARYKRAPESQRYRIMNQIKLEIARLNRSRQAEAIQQLRAVSRSIDNRRKHATKARKYHHRKHLSPDAILNGDTENSMEGSHHGNGNGDHNGGSHGGDGHSGGDHGGGSHGGGGHNGGGHH